MDLSVGCEHPVRVAGMCAICGIAVDEDSNDSQENSSQLHDISGIQVNTAEAARLDSESTRYLLSQRKLALIVDLDQTIIHATVDPTVGEWMKDTRNPNYKALENVGKFRLGTDGKAVMDSDENDEATKSTETSSSSAAGQQQQEGCWYYVKPRPGLQQFLAELAEKYEMYVYTMGTRSYAEGVCKLVDPQGNIFGARILSRDENGSLLQKSLKKLFPMDTSMVVIIDDRADVWKWSPNLLKVIPFDFFVGSGDINASFLPAAPTVPTPTTDGKGEDDGKSNNDNENKGEAKDGENGKSNTSGPTGDNKEEEGEKAKKEEAEATANAEKSQKSAVSEQLGSRPLAKMQEALDVKNDQQSKEQTKATTAVLKDDDQELKRLRGILDQMHSMWYQQWDARPSQDEKPDITSIIASLKSAVLATTTIVFSSIIPYYVLEQSSDEWRLACEFGAHCKTEIGDSVTHVVAAKPDTQKVFEGQKRNISVVWPSWLHDSCARWTRQSESHYALPKPTIPHAIESDGGGQSYDSDQLVFSTNDSDANTGGLLDDDEEVDEEDQGFGEVNWDEADDEVDAVLNGLSDGDDTTDGGYTTDGSSANRRKRTRSERSFDGEDDEDGKEDSGGKKGEDESETLSRLSKRKKEAESRVGQSKLKNVVPTMNATTTTTTTTKRVEMGNDSGYMGPKNEDAEDAEDDDFLQSLQDELELQLGGSDEEGGAQEGLASDDE